MRKFRVIDGSNDGSLAVPKACPPSVAPPADHADPPAPGEPSSPPSPDDRPAESADGLITASASYHAALQTTANIRQRSLLDFLR
jgi:hypothetical protein